MRENLEAGVDWCEKAARPVLNKVKWTWQKTGEHFGETGQFLLVLLVAGIASNVWSRMKKKETPDSRERQKRQYRRIRL